MIARRSAFRSELTLDATIAPLVMTFDGRHSVASVFDAARASNEVPATLTLDSFCDLVRTMIERGLLEID
jgi:hypothetical protein